MKEHPYRFSLVDHDDTGVTYTYPSDALAEASPDATIAAVKVWTTRDGRRYRPSAIRTYRRNSDGVWGLEP